MLNNYKRDPKTGAIINISKERTLEIRVSRLEKELKELKSLLKGGSNGLNRVKSD